MTTTMPAANVWAANISSNDSPTMAAFETPAGATTANLTLLPGDKKWSEMADEARADAEAGRTSSYESVDEMFTDLESHRRSVRGSAPEI